jgi:3',5'-cyclic AMP phosphodiesterase CpdA
MYKRYFGNPYYSFDHKGWHFIVLESIIDAGNNYKGYIDSTQVEWLKRDLEKIDRTAPVVVSTHIPLLTTYGQISKGATAPNDEELVVVNALDILNMLAEYNIKLILQGHVHLIEYIYLQQKVHFLWAELCRQSGGLVPSGAWKKVLCIYSFTMGMSSGNISTMVGRQYPSKILFSGSGY